MEELKEMPPLGLIPKWLHREMRVKDIKGAISRYLHHDKPIPKEWIEEYNELTSKVPF